MPEISRFYGIIIKMYFNDHNPPHFHAEYQGYKVIVSIEEGVVEGQMPKTALKLIFEWLDLHKGELLVNWETIRKTGKFERIKPLS